MQGGLHTRKGALGLHMQAFLNGRSEPRGNLGPALAPA